MGELRGLHVVVEADLVEALYAEAAKAGLTMSEAVTALLIEHLATRPARKPARRTPRIPARRAHGAAGGRPKPKGEAKS